MANEPSQKKVFFDDADPGPRLPAPDLAYALPNDAPPDAALRDLGVYQRLSSSNSVNDAGAEMLPWFYSPEDLVQALMTDRPEDRDVLRQYIMALLNGDCDATRAIDTSGIRPAIMRMATTGVRKLRMQAARGSQALMRSMVEADLRKSEGARGGKYIKRERHGDHWVYTYADDSKMHVPVEHDDESKPSLKHEGVAAVLLAKEGNRFEQKISGMDREKNHTYSTDLLHDGKKVPGVGAAVLNKFKQRGHVISHDDKTKSGKLLGHHHIASAAVGANDAQDGSMAQAHAKDLADAFVANQGGDRHLAAKRAQGKQAARPAMAQTSSGKDVPEAKHPVYANAWKKNGRAEATKQAFPEFTMQDHADARDAHAKKITARDTPSRDVKAHQNARDAHEDAWFSMPDSKKGMSAVVDADLRKAGGTLAKATSKKKKLVGGKGAWQFAKDQAKKKGKPDSYAAAIAARICGKGMDDGEEKDSAASLRSAEVARRLKQKENEGKVNKTIRAIVEEDLRKAAGEGSRGGKIIGHTKSGKPVYAGAQSTSTFTAKDHKDAEEIHQSQADFHRKQERANARSRAPGAGRLEEAHGQAADRHEARASRHRQIASDLTADTGDAAKSMANAFSLRDIVESDLRKAAGEGSRGGQVIGHTSSGKPIYADGSKSNNYHPDDHLDAAAAHKKESDKQHSYAADADKDQKPQQKKHDAAGESHYRQHEIHAAKAESMASKGKFGTTRSGKTVTGQSKNDKSFTKQDHADAAKIHDKFAAHHDAQIEDAQGQNKAKEQQAIVSSDYHSSMAQSHREAARGK